MPIRAIQTALSDAPAELVVVRPGKDRGGTPCPISGRGAGEGRSAHSGANFASVAPKRAHRSTRRHQNRRRWMRGSHPGTILSERAAAPVATVAIIEDAGDAWSMDLFSFLVTTGYTIAARSEQNVMLHLESAHP